MTGPLPIAFNRASEPPCIGRSFNRCVLLLECFPRANDASFLCGPRARHPIYWHDPCPIPRGLVERLDIILYADEPALVENGILYEKSANTDLGSPLWNQTVNFSSVPCFALFTRVRVFPSVPLFNSPMDMLSVRHKDATGSSSLSRVKVFVGVPLLLVSLVLLFSSAVLFFLFIHGFAKYLILYKLQYFVYYLG